MSDSPPVPWLDRLALRLSGTRPDPRAEVPAQGPAPEPVAATEATFTRETALKAFGAGAAMTVLPLALLESPAIAKRDCYQPCLGVIGEASRRGIRKCQSRPTDFVLSIGVMRTLDCLFHNTERLVNNRAECAEPECGKFGRDLQNGGTVENVPVPPLDLPAGTQSECENCQTAGGYCGVCPAGTTAPTQQFFCGTPGVQPCRYCAGC